MKISLKIFYPPYQGSGKLDPPPIVWQKMKIILGGCLIGQMKRFDALITSQKNLSSLQSPISLKIGIFESLYFLLFLLICSEMGLCLELSFFLRCNQFIKTLHLSYQTTFQDDFHFLPCNGGSVFSDPRQGGSNGVFGEK